MSSNARHLAIVSKLANVYNLICDLAVESRQIVNYQSAKGSDEGQGKPIVSP